MSLWLWNRVTPALSRLGGRWRWEETPGERVILPYGKEIEMEKSSDARELMINHKRWKKDEWDKREGQCKVMKKNSFTCMQRDLVVDFAGEVC